MTKKELLKLAAGMVAVLICIWLVARAEAAAQHDLVIGIIGILSELLVIVLWASHLTTGAIAELRQHNRTLIALLQERIPGADDLSTLLLYHDHALQPAQVQEVWVDLLCRMRRTYSATNYIDSKRIYDTDWGKAALAIQNGKKRAGQAAVVIRKVFLIDDPDEVAILSPHLEEQREIGVQLQYLYRGEIEQDPELRKCLVGLPSVDFGVFDDAHVLVWELDRRNVAGARVLFGSETVKRHRFFFDLLYLRAREKHGDETLLLRLRDAQREAISHWPAYSAPYEKLDYALRNPGGWLYTFGADPKCQQYGVYVGGECVGFSLLDRAGQDPLAKTETAGYQQPGDDRQAIGEQQATAEFYVAIHPRKLKKGFGRRATVATLETGFRALGLRRIFLKVRVGHPGERLYGSVGFEMRGTQNLVVNNETTAFHVMDITGERFLALHG